MRRQFEPECVDGYSTCQTVRVLLCVFLSVFVSHAVTLFVVNSFLNFGARPMDLWAGNKGARTCGSLAVRLYPPLRMKLIIASGQPGIKQWSRPACTPKHD